MTLVAGVDSSTQSCKVVICDHASGQVVRQGRAPHPDGTEVHPDAWWTALQSAIAAAGGLDDVAAVSVAGQQHGMVCLDDDGQVVRPALLWNDNRSAQAAEDLVADLDGGAAAWATAVGSVPVASFTVTKLRWLAEHEPESAGRTSAVCLPHDWLTWKLAVTSSLDTLVSDRSDASGTGYWSPATGAYRDDLLRMALGRVVTLPRIVGPADVAAETPSGQLLGAGAGDNAGAALGLSAGAGDVIVSLGTSGVASAISTQPSADPSGLVAGFADATGLFLPLACTLNAARVLDAAARILGVGLDELSDLALSTPAGADGLTLVPYLEGERTPNKPDATGALHGLRLGNSTPGHIARAYMEGMLCGLADGVDALVEQGVEVRRILLIGGAAGSPAVRQIAPTVFGQPVIVPPTGEYVALGAARQAAWVAGDRPAAPEWPRDGTASFEVDEVSSIRSRYAEVREMTATRPPGRDRAETDL